MPRLLVFAPCERVIISEENTTSLITLLDALRLNIPETEDDKIPAGAVLPVSWNIFTLWRAEEGDIGKQFEERVQLALPNGQYAAIGGGAPILDFSFAEGKPNHRVVFNVMGFPIVPAGTCSLELSIRSKNQDDWKKIMDYPLVIDRPKKDASD